VQKRIKVVEAYFATKSVAQTQRHFWRDFPLSRLKRPNQCHNKAIKRLLDKFRKTGSVQDSIKGRSGRLQSLGTDNHIVTVRQCYEQSSKKSSRLLSQETDLSRHSIMRIMSQDLHLFRIRYRFCNFRPLQITLRDVPLCKPSVSESKTILISWTSFSSMTRQISALVVT